MPTRKPSAALKLLRITLFFCMFALIAAGAAIMGARAVFSPSRVRALTVHHLSRRLDREVFVGAARISWRGTITLENVRIFDKKPGNARREVFRCASVVIAQSAKDFLRGRRRLSHVAVYSPFLEADVAAMDFAAPDFAKALEMSRYRYRGKTSESPYEDETGGAPPVVLKADEIRIIDGAVDVVRGGKPAFRISRIGGSLKNSDGLQSIEGGFVYSDKNIEAAVKISGAADTAKKTLDLSGLEIELKGAVMKGKGVVANYSDASAFGYKLNLRVPAGDAAKFLSGDFARFKILGGNYLDVEISGSLEKTRVDFSTGGKGVAINF